MLKQYTQQQPRFAMFTSVAHRVLDGGRRAQVDVPYFRSCRSVRCRARRRPAVVGCRFSARGDHEIGRKWNPSAVALFILAAAAWAEARLTRRVAAAHQRLATLHYDEDSAQPTTTAFCSRLPMPGSSQSDVDEHRAAVNYWLARYEALTPLTGATGDQPSSNPNVLFVAANARVPGTAIRKPATTSSPSNGWTACCRATPTSFARTLTSLTPRTTTSTCRVFATCSRRASRSRKPAAKADDSVDLPSGPTLHGKPGGPAGTVPMSDFKTVSPMRFDEREEQPEPGKGKAPIRHG